MKISINLSGRILVLVTAHQVLAYNEETCCELAKRESQFLSPVPETQICGQVYSPSLPAAEPFYVSYAFCRSQCKGIELSKVSNPNQWAASLVQFFLPSVIFSMSIPRRKKIEYDYSFEFEWPKKLTPWKDVNEVVQLLASLVCFVIVFIPVMIDVVVWIAAIVVAAGDMIVGELGDSKQELSMKRELLVTVTCGNLMLNKGNPLEAITKSIVLPGDDEPKEGKEKARSRLLSMLDSQTSFGSAVGSPVLFYLGAFIYTILALRPQLGDEDSAFALGFGIEWMVIVNVAIISGCLLASNNPSTSAAIVGSGHEALDLQSPGIRRAGTPHSRQSGEDPKRASRRRRKHFYHRVFGWTSIYETTYQPVSLWSRGNNKILWIKRTKAYKSPDGKLRKRVEITPLGWIFKIFLPTLALAVSPPALAAIITHYTPPRGIGCRTLSCLIYTCCQVVSTIIATVRCAVDDGVHPRVGITYFFTGWRFIALSSTFWFGSLVAAVGGITMQTIGVFRNCICASPPSSWVNIRGINPSINLATDIQAARDSSVYWLWIGTTAAWVMIVVTYVGWWYQRSIRSKFTAVVKGMFEPESSEGMDFSGVSVTSGHASEGREKEQQWVGSMAIPLLNVNRVRSKLQSSSDGSDSHDGKP